MTTDNKILKDRKPNSSIASCSVLLGVKPEVIEACLPMLQYVNRFNAEQFEIWKERNHYIYQKDNNA